MPKSNNNRRFLQFTGAEENHNMTSTATSQSALSVKQQRCFVCYNEFVPFAPTTDKWETNLIKMFYSALNLPSPDDGTDEDGEDPVISLPFCPPCHSKISVMASLHGQMQIIQGQFSKIRNDVVFTIVETNEKNCRKGPMDFIRQQIYDKWKDRFEEAKAKEYFNKVDGLESIVQDSTTLSKAVPDEFIYPNLESTSEVEEFSNSLDLAISPFGGIGTQDNGTAVSRNQSGSSNHNSVQNNASPKRPVRTAALANFLAYNESASVAKYREMESVFKSTMSSPPMPKLIPMGSQTFRAKQTGSSYPSIGSQNLNSSSEMLLDADGKGTGKRMNSTSNDDERVPLKLPRVGSGFKKRIGVAGKGKFQSGIKRKPGRPFGWRKPVAVVNPALLIEPQTLKPGSRSLRKGGLKSEMADTEEEGEPGSGNKEDFACRLCPKVYYNVSRLRRHESLCHPSVKALQCSLCPNGFSSMLAFRRHMMHQHHQAVTGLTTITCAICRKTFAKQSAFELHMTTHEKSHHSSPSLSQSGAISIRTPTRKRSVCRPRVSLEVEQPEEREEETGSEPADVEVNEDEQHMENADNINETEPVDNLVLVAQPKTKKKPKYFAGARKRKRRFFRKPAGPESQNVIKKEPDEQRVIISRKRYNNLTPVRKSSRRAESLYAKPAVHVTDITEKEDETKVDSATSVTSAEDVPDEAHDSKSDGRDDVHFTDANQGDKAIGLDEEIQDDESTKSSRTSQTSTTPGRPRREKASKNSVASTPLSRARLVCPICALEYPFIGLLNMHIRSHPRDETKCEDCKTQLSSFEEYRGHVTFEHKRELLPCTFCDEEFGSEKYLMGHELIHKYERSRGREKDKPTTAAVNKDLKQQTLRGLALTEAEQPEKPALAFGNSSPQKEVLSIGKNEADASEGVAVVSDQEQMIKEEDSKGSTPNGPSTNRSNPTVENSSVRVSESLPNPNETKA